MPRQIAYISTFTTLVPGDIIVTGTPTGAGARFDPPVYLEPGDVIEVEADGIGVCVNGVVDESMSISQDEIARAAADLYEAERSGRQIGLLSQRYPDLIWTTPMRSRLRCRKQDGRGTRLSDGRSA